MDPEKQAILKNAGRDIVVNLLKLFAALCVIAFFWGGSTTRSWMLAFLGGTIAGLSNQREDLAGGYRPDSHRVFRLHQRDARNAALH